MRIIGQRGYIGSTLGLPNTLDSHGNDYTVLLAGHSSVPMCQHDPEGAWTNNVEFFRAILRSIGVNELFIYASSASLYNGVKNPTEEATDFHLNNMYDLTKHTIDNLAQLSHEQWYSLRFATVNGWSPNLRVDIMLNKMVYDAKTRGIVTITNPGLVRPVLGINDLGRAIEHILVNIPPRGIYNLASITYSVGEMAEYVAQRFDAKIITDKWQSSPYVFQISTEKFANTGFKFTDTLESIVESLDKPFIQTGVRV